MWSSTSPSYLLHAYHSRRLLLHAPLYQSPDSAAPPSTVNGDVGKSSFDANEVVILSVLVCAVICVLGLNSILRCVSRCSTEVDSESVQNAPTRLADTGIDKKALRTFPMLTYSAELKLPGLDTGCIICISEYTPEERIRVLPKCNHMFHIRCIDKWLMSHSSCPTCRDSLNVDTCLKIVSAGGQASSSEPPPPPLQGSIVPILDPESLKPLMENVSNAMARNRQSD